ncbi:MAG: protein kinase [Cyanobacteria bacterium REEB67]|nr:protein kinase [Cyanobacteria bacterium REEB67]
MAGESLDRRPSLAIGAVVGGDYEIISFIGAGGMGDVYRVRHQLMQAEYALKTLSADKVTDSAWRRFQTEAQAIARLSHPNIVGIYNLGIHEGRLPFYVMDILVGRTLQDMLQERGRLPLKKALAILIDASAGLAYAHKKGIVHRDIKPANIVILDRPDAAGARLKIVDFGIAKLSEIDSLPSQQLTQAGEVCGSPYYMSPEQCEGGYVDARSDIYSLGCTIFEALTSAPPFRGRTAVETMMMHQGTRPPTLQAACPAALDAYGTIDRSIARFPPMLEMVIATMLAKDPGDRYQNLDRLIKDLHTIAREEFGGQTATRDSQPIIAGEAEPAASPETALQAEGERRLFLTKADAHKAERTNLSNGENAARAPIIRAAAVLAGIIGAVVLVGGAVVSFNRPHHQENGSLDKATTSGAQVKSVAVRAEPTNQKMDFARVIYKDGEKYVCFDFPSNLALGEIGYTSKDGPTRHACKGKFEIKQSAQPILKAGLTFIQHPEYLDRFETQSLSGLELASTFMAEDFDDATMAHVGRLKNLEVLKILFCGRVSNRSLAQIDALPRLSCLDASDTQMTVIGLNRLKRIKNLTELTLLTEESLSPLLQKLSGSTALKYLDVHRSKLTTQDCKSIAACSRLETLKLDDCAISDAQIEALSPLHNIGHLSLVNNTMTAASIPNILKMLTRPPRSLKISSRAMRPEDAKAFHAPSCGFNLN